MFSEILNEINKYLNKNEDNNRDKYINNEENEHINANKIIYPENEEDENKQIESALKKSEEEAKLILEKEEEEERQLQMALKESEKEYNINKYKDDKNENAFSLQKEEEFDEEYGICPITQEYMQNPVISPSGNYYEKSAIIDWINKNKTDPMTREPLTADMLIEDEEYRKQIIEFRKKYNK